MEDERISSPLNIVYAVHRVPYPPDKGDRIRAFHLLKYLSTLGRLHLVCLADEPVPASVRDALSQYVERLAIVPLVGWSRWPRALLSLATGKTVTAGAFSSPVLRRILREWSQSTKFDVAIASASSMVPYLRLPELQQIPSIVDLVDLDSEKWLEYAATSHGPKAWLYRVEGRRLRRLEAELRSWARAITLVSESEAAMYRRECGEGPVYAVSNGVDLEYFQPRDEEPEEAAGVFVGALDYRPNIDGICWFCEEIWPGIRRLRPKAKIYLVGRQPVPAVRKLAEIEGVVVVGQVDDVRPYVAKAAFAVVPLRIARGIQNKVLEAMAMGKPVVASPEPLVGLRVEHGKDVLSAATPGEWQENVVALIDDSGLRARIGSAGREYVETNHCWETRLEPFARLLRNCDAVQDFSTGVRR